MEPRLQARWAGGHCHCPPVPQALAVAAWAAGEQQMQPVPSAELGTSAAPAQQPEPWQEGAKAAAAWGLNGSQKTPCYCKKSSRGSVGSLG